MAVVEVFGPFRTELYAPTNIDPALGENEDAKAQIHILNRGVASDMRWNGCAVWLLFCDHLKKLPIDLG
ncbi:hypothetical protein U9M48_012486 [Paspalum notatum var. saurae]|uniref:Uncharacterized protein n=1 Tax=Paspalum notatum var. saurae TaxID=547442 RepID=A0AAQ3T050_PASNO